MTGGPDSRPPARSGTAAPDPAATAPRGGGFVPRLEMAGIVVLALALRLALLGRNSLWYDEAHTAWTSAMPWWRLFEVVRAVDTHPPLYYAVIKVWTAVAGASEAALRLPSACFGAASVVLTYALARRIIPPRAAVLAAFFSAVAPLGIMASQDARMYTLLELLTLGATLALVRAAATRRRPAWAAYAGLVALTVYTHYLGLLVVAAQGLWTFRYRRAAAPGWLGSVAVAAVLYAPWVPSAWWQVTHPPFLGWYAQPLYGSVADLAGLFAFGGSLLGTATFFAPGALPLLDRIILVLPFLLVCWRGVAALRTDRDALALVGLPLGVTVGGMLLVSLVRPLPVFVPRWFSFLWPFYAILLARGVFDVADHVRARADRVVACVTAALLLSSVPTLAQYYLDPAARVERWRDAAVFVAQGIRRDDVLVFASPDAAIAFGYYLRRPGSAVAFLPAPLTTRWIDELATGHREVWLVVRGASNTPELAARLRLLVTRFAPAGSRDFGGIEVDRLTPTHG